jgi:nitroreductase
VRQFSDTPVDDDLIENAVSMAIKTPSVCNRQTWKVYACSDQDQKNRLLKHQNGNRGFGPMAGQILIVTSDLNLFVGAAERNQSFIDGGLFSMSLIYALHSLGLGTCCLNWSVTMERDKALRHEAGIDDSESIIMLIAVGHLPDTLSVACSPRRKTEEVLKFM